jgi:hypothetical protein
VVLGVDKLGVMIQPATLKITPEILGFISELDEFKGAWRALGTLAPERLSALRKVATIESIGSSTRIEGSKLSDGRLKSCWLTLESSPSIRGMSRKWPATPKPWS